MAYDMEAYYQLVEEALQSIGVDPQQAAGEEPGQWTLERSKALLMIDLWFVEEEGRPFFQILSPVIDLQSVDDHFGLFRRLLEDNYRVQGSGFCLLQDAIYLNTVRPVEEIDGTIVAELIKRTGFYSDFFIEQLQERFGSNT
jgi:hypothetical protein